KLQGKSVPAGDKISVYAAQEEVRQFKEKEGENSHWTNSMFGGMPTYYITFSRSKDLVDYSRKLFTANMPGEAGYIFLGMLFFYLLMLLLGISPWLSIIGSVSFAFATNNIVLLDAGHITKFATIMSGPLVIAGVILAYRSKLFLAFIVFSLGMAINLKCDHPQMTYYLGLILLPFVIIAFIDFLKKKKLKEFVLASAVLLAGLAVGAGCSTSKLLPIMEYSKDTMRGKPILQNNSSTYSSSTVEGLSWDYAMNWSNGIEDLLQSFISHSVGGSSAENLSTDSNFGRELRKRGANVRGGIQAPMYWGSLPFTSGPIYFGAIIFLLFFIGLFYIDGRLKWWILIGFALTFLLSMGKNFELLSRFFFDYVPMYNKFRTPNSILSVTTIIVPILAILALEKILNKREIDLKKVIYPGVGLAVFCVLVGLIGPGFSDMTSAYDARYAQMGLDPSILQSDRAEMMKSSSFRSAILMFLSMALIWFYGKGKINRILVLTGVALLCIGDLFSVNLKYLKPSDYVSQRNLERNYELRPVDQQILRDNDPNYRVLDLTIPTFESSLSSYYHKTIGGYHAAKLQRFQDMIDYHITKNNIDVLNMLNTKYVISNGNNNVPDVQRNTAALGNAWFVNNIRMVNSADEEIEALNNFDPLGEAIVHQEFSDVVANLDIQKNGSIELVSYKPNELIYSSNANTDQLAVFSEIWYGPNKGWKAYIDDQPAEHIRANYILRAMKVPAGKHTIRFEFSPDSVKLGQLISLLCSMIIFIAFGFYVYKNMKKKD
ncbi:MAG: YfhO family protein, partial [Bacteroidia bacterium]|nr:YfhO family protein [Bacteroidia bacterium]